MTTEEKRLCRWLVDKIAEVYEVDGSSPPKTTGRRSYYTTLSGKTEVRHPRAYGYPCVYHRSTFAIEVGRDWLAKNAKFYDWRSVHGVRAYYDVRTFIKRTMPGGLEMRAVKSGRGDHWLVTTDEDATHINFGNARWSATDYTSYNHQCLWRLAFDKIEQRKQCECRERMAKIKSAIDAMQGMQPSAVPVLARHARSTGSCQTGIDEFVRRFKCRSWETAKKLLTIAPTNDFVRRAVRLAAFECATTVSI